MSWRTYKNVVIEGIEIMQIKNTQLQRLLKVSIWSYFTKTFCGVRKKVVQWGLSVFVLVKRPLTCDCYFFSQIWFLSLLLLLLLLLLCSTQTQTFVFCLFFVNNYGHFMIQSTKKLFKTYFVNSNFNTRDLLSDWERSLHLFRDFFHPFETISPHSGSKPNFMCNVSFWYI